MDNEDKIVQSFKDIKPYRNIIEKLSASPWELNYMEKVFVLSIAILLLKQNGSLRSGAFAELAYYIILKYSLFFKDYGPLYDYSVNAGLYPIVRALEQQGLVSHKDIASSLLDDKIVEKYQRGVITETYEQNKVNLEIINDTSKDASFLAPTSYGKSSTIIERLKMNISEGLKKMAIIVPSKSLLAQTYKKVRLAKFDAKIIVHDDMYNDEERIVAVLTQERALRLLEKSKLYFDILYIDEAHNLLEDSNRAVLLSRLIKLNRKRNPQSKILYLSPIIADSDSLKIDAETQINEHKITSNMKEPEYYEYRVDGKILKYNRFIDSFIKTGETREDIFSYIKSYSSNKTFCYLRSPKKVETFASELSASIPPIEDNPKIDEIIENLEKHVHKDFIAIECLRHGIVFLHGKMPDEIKEYLECKYAQIPELKYIIANKVILEGINLPIDSLFILNGTGLYQKDLINLIGRVNRLDKIFGEQPRLDLLIPKIHFVNSAEYNRKNGNLEAKMKLLKSPVADTIDNPTLAKFDIETAKNKNKNLERIKTVISQEEKFFNSPNDPIEELERRMIGLGLNTIYNLSTNLCEKIYDRIILLKNNKEKYSIHILDRMRQIFVRDLKQYITDKEFARLVNDEASTYYKMFFKDREKTLKQNIAKEIWYYGERIKRERPFLYVGASYGEVPCPNSAGYANPVYIDLRTKDHKELVNIAIRKRKMEEDFVGFKMNMLFQLMYDYEVITEAEYYKAIFCTDDGEKLELAKTGLPINLINFLEAEGQLKNISLDQNGNLSVNDEFLRYKDECDDFTKFEIEKVL